MEKSELLALEELSQLSPTELRTESPELFSQLETMAASQLKVSLGAQLAGSSQELRTHIEDLDLSDVVGSDRDVRHALIDSLETRDLPQAAVQEAQERLGELEHSSLLPNPLPPDVPLKDLPLVQPKLQQAKTYLLGEAIGLDDTKVEAVL